MRVTNSMSVLKHTSAIQNNLQKVDKVNEKLNTMKNINRLSDDPYSAVKVMNLNNEIKTSEKYEKNCDDAIGWLDTTDGVMDSIGTVVKNIKESLVKAGNGTYTEDQINTIGKEVNENIKELADLLNSTHGGKYILSGSETGEPPVKCIETKDANGNEVVKLELNSNVNFDKLKMSVSQGIDVEYNVTLDEIMKGTGGLDDLFKDINDLSEAFASGKSGIDISLENSSKMDTLFNNIVDTRATFGVRSNTVEVMKNKNEDDIVKLKENLSKTQDVDFAQVFMELKQAELVYTASIQTGAKVMQNNILNYL